MAFRYFRCPGLEMPRRSLKAGAFRCQVPARALYVTSPSAANFAKIANTSLGVFRPPSLPYIGIPLLNLCRLWPLILLIRFDTWWIVDIFLLYHEDRLHPGARPLSAILLHSILDSPYSPTTPLPLPVYLHIFLTRLPAPSLSNLFIAFHHAGPAICPVVLLMLNLSLLSSSFSL